jgi:hypothetical protein
MKTLVFINTKTSQVTAISDGDMSKGIELTQRGFKLLCTTIDNQLEIGTQFTLNSYEDLTIPKPKQPSKTSRILSVLADELAK